MKGGSKVSSRSSLSRNDTFVTGHNPVERDLHFDADKTISAYADEARTHGRIITRCDTHAAGLRVGGSSPSGRAVRAIPALARHRRPRGATLVALRILGRPLRIRYDIPVAMSDSIGERTHPLVEPSWRLGACLSMPHEPRCAALPQPAARIAWLYALEVRARSTGLFLSYSDDRELRFFRCWAFDRWRQGWGYPRPDSRRVEFAPQEADY